MESWDEWLQFSNTVPSAEYLDYGFGDTSYSVGPDQFDIDDELSPYRPYAEHADFIGHVSELPSDVEIGTPPAQYRDSAFFKDPYGQGSGISFLEMPDQEFKDLYEPTAEDNYLNKLAGMLQAAGQVAKAADPIFGGKRDKRDLSRFGQAQPGNVPVGVGLSGARVRETRAEMINRENIAQLFNRTSRTGIDADYRLMNVPQPRPVSIPSGTIGTTSSKRRIYGK